MSASRITARRRRPWRRLSRQPVRGAVLLGVLLVLGLVAIAQAVLLERWSVARQREREQELHFVGEQYRRALASYARATPAGAPPAPATLEELLEDRRFPRPVAHLRRLWPDPFTGRADWQLLRAGGRIVGLHSRSAQPVYAPPPGWREDGPPATARDWRFVHAGPTPGPLGRP